MIEISYPLEAGDLERMMEIERLSFPSPWSEEDVKTALESGGRIRCLGICEDGALVGWGCFAAGFEEAHLMTLAIHPDHRQSGLGSALLGAVLQAASDSGARYMALECRKGNTAAQKLYRSLGFLKVGARPGYYLDTGEDALIYVHPALPEGDSERDPFLIRE